jgi:hypothetical protein
MNDNKSGESVDVGEADVNKIGILEYAWGYTQRQIGTAILKLAGSYDSDPLYDWGQEVDEEVEPE